LGRTYNRLEEPSEGKQSACSCGETEQLIAQSIASQQYSVSRTARKERTKGRKIERKKEKGKQEWKRERRRTKEKEE
jgi:hypothetical protein